MERKRQWWFVALVKVGDACVVRGVRFADIEWRQEADLRRLSYARSRPMADIGKVGFWAVGM